MINEKQTDDGVMTLSSADTCFERARKILKVAGIVDGVGISSRMAEAIEKYKEMDTEVAIKAITNALQARKESHE